MSKIAYQVSENWACYGPEDSNGTWLNETLKTDCMFQFWKSEGITSLIFSILIIPANCFAIHQFYKRKINKIFFILTASLCIGNMLMAINGFVNGLINVSDPIRNWFGYYGCAFCFTSAIGIRSCTMMIHAIISYERRKAIASTTFLTTFNYRVYSFLGLSVVYGVVVAYMYFIKPFGALAYVEARYEKSSNDTIWVCANQDFGFLGLAEITWGIVVIGIQLSIIIYNYWPIWKQAYKARMSTNDVVVVGQKKMQIRLALIMSATVVEFVVFQMPSAVMALGTLVEKVTGHLHLGSSVLTFIFFLWYFDAAINPMWSVFLTKGKRPASSITTTP